ncbi:DAK2 domain-containing protein [Mesorhizobium sp. NZP2298]|uniref:DAK2 domain-containing protein n=1 Tax=Mesorhizobium sp. NZP2298 TaxID=2483403 RepID=UPI001554D885|nr:DAK2 domain-containing protein [Mesorhizobium sp. NZP2298]
MPGPSRYRSRSGLPAEQDFRRGRRAGATASTSPRLGGASYLGERAVGAPDGGAAAVAIWMRAIAQAIARQG